MGAFILFGTSILLKKYRLLGHLHRGATPEVWFCQDSQIIHILLEHIQGGMVNAWTPTIVLVKLWLLDQFCGGALRRPHSVSLDK